MPAEPELGWDREAGRGRRARGKGGGVRKELLPHLKLHHPERQPLQGRAGARRGPLLLANPVAQPHPDPCRRRRPADLRLVRRPGIPRRRLLRPSAWGRLLGGGGGLGGRDRFWLRIGAGAGGLPSGLERLELRETAAGGQARAEWGGGVRKRCADSWPV